MIYIYPYCHLFMKITKIIGGATLCLAMAIGVGVGIGVKSEVKNVKADETYTYNAGDVLYFDDNNNSGWTGADRVAAYFFGDGDYWCDTLTAITPAYDHSGTIYKFVLPDIGSKNYTHIIFVAMNDSGEASWSNRKAQTTDLEIRYFYGKNYFQVNGTQYNGNYDCNWLYREPTIKNGVYLRGTIQGETHWDSSNDKAFTGTGTYTINIELYADDIVKAVLYNEGETIWLQYNTGADGTETAKGTAEFPVNVSDGNGVVTNRGVYNITAQLSNIYEGTQYWDYSFEDEATTWAKVFLGVNGSSDCSYAKANWSTLSTAYAALNDTSAKAVFVAETHVDHGTDLSASSYIVQAVQRYDYVLERYGVNAANTDALGYTDFIGRLSKLTLASLATSKEINNNADYSLIIVITSAVALATISGLFFLKKRKEDR